jgi:hypothetical protein
MRVQTISIVVCIITLGLAAPVTCFAQSDAEAAAELRGRITLMIDAARCNNIVNCRVLGLGSRPCGGPEEYVAYSIWDTQVDEIRSLAAEYNFLREEVDATDGKVGTCEVLPEPAVNCINARCVTVPSRR